MIPLILGIAIGLSFPAESILLPALFFPISCIIYFFLQKLKASYREMLFILCIISFGYLISQTTNPKQQTQHITRIQDLKNYPYLLVQLTEAPVKKEKSYQLSAHLNALIKDTQSRVCSGDILIYIPKNADISVFQNNHYFIIPNQLKADFYEKISAYYHRKNIYYYTYVSVKNFIPVRQPPPSLSAKISSFIRQLREKIIRQINFCFTQETIKNYVSAILIGYKEHLDKDLKQSYQTSGLSHIMAISGLHLGIIYGLIYVLSNAINTRKKIGKYFKLSFLLFFLGAYVLIASGGDSIYRSGLMYGILAITQIYGKQSNIYNNLSFAAFVILCLYPNHLLDLGFQLSFLSFLGILILYPVLEKSLIKKKTPVRSFILGIGLLSLATQLFTLPITLSTFQYFPTYFLIANYVAIPVITLVLPCIFILVCLSFIQPSAAQHLSYIVEWLITQMNAFIQLLSKLPYARIDTLFFQQRESVIYFIALFFFLFYAYRRKKIYLIYTLSLYALLLISIIGRKAAYIT